MKQLRNLVVSSFNPFEKYESLVQLDHFPRGNRGVKLYTKLETTTTQECQLLGNWFLRDLLDLLVSGRWLSPGCLTIPTAPFVWGGTFFSGTFVGLKIQLYNKERPALGSVYREIIWIGWLSKPCITVFVGSKGEQFDLIWEGEYPSMNHVGCSKPMNQIVNHAAIGVLLAFVLFRASDSFWWKAGLSVLDEESPHAYHNPLR